MADDVIRATSRDVPELAVATRHPRTIVPTLLGFAGSLAILVGSASVGWIAPGSSLLHVQPLRTLRASAGASELSSILVVLGGLALLGAWLLLGRLLAHSDQPLRLILSSSAAWALPLLFTLPLFSRDAFSYVAQGRLILAGLNPYHVGVSALAGWQSAGVDPLWANTPTPYGPLFVTIEGAVVRLLGSSSEELQLFAFRLLAIAGGAAMAYYGYRIAEHRRVDSARTLWVLAASPLVMITFVVSSHNDALMLGLIFAGVYYAMKRHPIAGILLVTAAVGIKPIALVALPVIGIIWAGRGASWPRRILLWAVSGVICMGLLGVLGLVQGIGYGWISSLSSPVSIITWFSPVGLLAGLVGAVTAFFGGPSTIATDVVKTAGLLVGLAGAGWVMLTRRPYSGEVRLALTLTAIVTLSPVIYPWYGLWVIAAVAVVGVADGWAMRLTVFATIFLTCVSLNEPMDVLPDLTGGFARATVVVVATLGCTVILAVSYFHRKWTKIRPKLSESFSTR